MVSSLLDTYKRQMALMRNFAKMSQMVGDKAYTNNMAKSIFNKRKYDAIFDNDEWINNNESGFSEAEKDTYNKLKEKVASGEISKYDFHTYLTNAEILRMNAGIKSSKTIEDLQQESLDIDNSNKPPIINEAKAKSKERLKKIRDTKLEELQDTFWSGVDMGAAIAADRWSEPIENEKLKNPFVDVLTLTKGEKIIDSKGEVKVVDNVVSDLFDFCLQGFYLCIVQFQSCLDLVPMFLGKLVKIVGKHLFHRLAEHTSRQSLNLQQEAFLQTSSSYTGWVEGL